MNATDELLNHWQTRLQDAKHRLDFARLFAKEVQKDYREGSVPPPDSEFALRRALRAERMAWAEYLLVLKTVTALLFQGEPRKEERNSEDCGKLA